MPIVFDGPNTTITLASGVTDVEAKDIYSRWKDWVTIGDNAKYLPAFRTIGGDPLSPVVDAGSYFFIQNQNGWRIKPPEEDITIFISGNLALEDTGQAGLIATTGAFSTAILGLQPVTQGVTTTMKMQLEYTSFESAVWVDQTNGEAGTGYNSAGLPIGTPENPVDNIPDAIAIQGNRGLPRTIMVLGNLSLGVGDDISGFKLIGENAARTQINVGSPADTIGCEIIEAYVTGNLDGGTILRNCVIDNLNYVNGFVFQCMLNPGTITLGGTNTAHFLSCYSGVPGLGTPTIDMDGAGGENTPLAMRDYNGGIRLVQKTGNADVSIDLNSGQVKLEMSTITATSGKIIIRGDGQLSNYDDGTHIDTGYYNGTDPNGVYIYNGLTGADHVHDIWRAMDLDTNPTGKVADMVWDAPMANHTDAGTTGLSLSTASSGGVDVNVLATAVWNKAVGGSDPDSFGEIMFRKAYEQGVYVSNSGTAGTAYPTGTAGDPVSNIADAVTIANNAGVKKLIILNNITIAATDVVDDFEIIGTHAIKSVVTIDNGADTVETTFQNCKVTGNMGGQAIFRECVIEDLNNVRGIMFQCMLFGNIQFNGGQPVHILSCYSGAGLSTLPPVIDYTSAVTDLIIRDWSGPIKFENNTNNINTCFDYNTGVMILDASMTTGTFSITGAGGSIQDNSVGATIMKGGALPADIPTEVWQRLGLDEDNPATNNPDGSFAFGGVSVGATTGGGGEITHQRA